MRKVTRQMVSVVLGLAIALVVSGCGDSTGNQSPGTGTAPTTTPVSVNSGAVAAGKIKVTVPDGWRPVERSMAPAQYIKGTNSFIAKTESFAVTDLDSIIKQALAAFEKSFSNVAVQGQPEPITVDGREGRKMIFTCEVSGLKMKYIYVYVRVGGQTWALTFGGMGDSFDALNADYQAILNQVKFE